jgi:hypothetical protein
MLSRWPELVESILGQQEIVYTALEFSAAIKEAGLCLVHAREVTSARAIQGSQRFG